MYLKENWKEINEQYINKLEKSQLEKRISLLGISKNEHIIQLVEQINREAFDGMREAYRSRGLI